MNRHRSRTLILVAALLATFAGLTLNALLRESATFDETTHLAAGYTYWRYNDYRLNPEHPPLLKRLAALPLLAQSVWPTARIGIDDSASTQLAERAWAEAITNSEAQWSFSHAILYGPRDSTLLSLGVRHPLMIPPTAALNDADFLNNADRLLLLGRLPTVVLGIGLGLLIFLWARELYGAAGGVFALAFYCLDPNFIAHSGLVTTDIGAALFTTGTVYFLWRYGCRQRFRDAILTALFFALAVSSKFSGVLLVPVLIVALTALPRQTAVSKRVVPVLVCAVALYAILWLSYGFRFSAINAPESRPVPLEDVLRRTAATRLLLAQTPGRIPEDAIHQAMSTVDIPLTGKLMLFACRHRLLPEAFVYGFALAESSSLQRDAFLLGAFSSRGWWYYFPIAFALKTPLITQLAMLAGLLYSLWCGEMNRKALLYLLLPVAVYLAASTTSNLNIGHRHLLPLYPFLFVLCGSLGSFWEKLTVQRGSAAVVAFAAIALNTQFVLWRPTIVGPDYLAYFNELAGGPGTGYKCLVDSNLDWGQDLKKLSLWLKSHQVREPINLCYFGTADPRYYGILHVNMPGGYMFEPAVPFEGASIPGYIAISATSLQGVYLAPELRAAWQEFLKPARLVGTVGHSIFIYYRD